MREGEEEGESSGQPRGMAVGRMGFRKCNNVHSYSQIHSTCQALKKCGYILNEVLPFLNCFNWLCLVPS